MFFPFIFSTHLHFLSHHERLFFFFRECLGLSEGEQDNQPGEQFGRVFFFFGRRLKRLTVLVLLIAYLKRDKAESLPGDSLTPRLLIG